MSINVCNPSHSGGRDWEVQNLRLDWAKSSRDPISANKKVGCGGMCLLLLLYWKRK
jgi:hypothetical protein